MFGMIATLGRGPKLSRFDAKIRARCSTCLFDQTEAFIVGGAYNIEDDTMIALSVFTYQKW